jgi:hypothetical protein
MSLIAHGITTIMIGEYEHARHKNECFDESVILQPFRLHRFTESKC